jgi:DNA-directed RNA polymerase specialized sigma24 family protein
MLRVFDPTCPELRFVAGADLVDASARGDRDENLEAQLGARADLASVRAQLAQMAPERVTGLLLHTLGHDIEEIAALTSTSLAAALSRLSRARRELRERLRDDAAENANPVRSWK